MNIPHAGFRSSLCVVAAAALLAFGAAQAAVVTVGTSLNPLQAGTDNQGWWSDLATNNISVNDNYLTLTDNSDASYRSFFSFDLSGVSGTVTGARFDVRQYNMSRTVSLGLWDVSTAAATLITTRTGILSPTIFADLGSGTSYGLFSVSRGASTDILTFALNAAALNDINARVGVGYFSIGAALQGEGSIFNGSGDEPGISSGQENSIQNLVLTIAPAGTVPEPGSFLLVGLALLGAGIASRRQRPAAKQARKASVLRPLLVVVLGPQAVRTTAAPGADWAPG